MGTSVPTREHASSTAGRVLVLRRRADDGVRPAARDGPKSKALLFRVFALDEKIGDQWKLVQIQFATSV